MLALVRECGRKGNGRGGKLRFHINIYALFYR